MALLLSRQVGESIQIGDDVKITIYGIRGAGGVTDCITRHSVEVAIEAPRNVQIVRTELLAGVPAQQKETEE